MKWALPIKDFDAQNIKMNVSLTLDPLQNLVLPRLICDQVDNILIYTTRMEISLPRQGMENISIRPRFFK